VGLRVVEVFEGEIGHDAVLLATGLTRRHFDVDVVCPPAAAASFDGSGARVIPMPVTAGVGGVAALRKVIRGYRVDVVHAHGLRAGLATSLARSGATPLVLTWLDPVPTAGAAGLTGWALARTVVATADLTLAATADLVATATRLGGRDVQLAPLLLPDPTPPRRTPAEVRDELGFDAGAPLLLSRGRLHTRSRHDVLIAAAARWRVRRPMPQVVIVGVGPAYRDLVAQTAVGRAPVTFVGDREHNAPDGEGATLPDLIRAADLAVVTGARARPLFAMQAARAGRALVVPAGGTVAQLLGSGAEQVPQGDVDALDAAIQGLLDDGAARAELAAAATAAARAWPGVEAAVDQIAAAYTHVTDTARDAPGGRR
jgi:glycosyltransferase involved in cell wall biosynthesis